MASPIFALRRSRWLTLAAAMLISQGCGDGDTEPSPPPPAVNEPPSVTLGFAEQDEGQPLVELSRVTLQASAINDPDGDALQTAWQLPADVELLDIEQTSGEGTALLTFTVPRIHHQHETVVSFKVSDGTHDVIVDMPLTLREGNALFFFADDGDEDELKDLYRWHESMPTAVRVDLDNPAPYPINSVRPGYPQTFALSFTRDSLFLVDAHGPLTTLVEPAPGEQLLLHSPFWSPDGARLAVLINRTSTESGVAVTSYKLTVFEFEGEELAGEETFTAPEGAGTLADVVGLIWSPNSADLIIAGEWRESGVVEPAVLDVVSGDISPLLETIPDTVEFGYCQWDPQGVRVGCEVTVDGEPQTIAYVEPASNTHVLVSDVFTAQAGLVTRVDWSHDGRWLAFRGAARTANVFETYVYDTSTASLAFPTGDPDSERGTSPTLYWSPTRDLLVYSERQGNGIYRVRVIGCNEGGTCSSQDVTGDVPAGTTSHPSIRGWSGDGNQLAFAGRLGTLSGTEIFGVEIAADGVAQPRRVFSAGRVYSGGVQVWAPSGARLAFNSFTETGDDRRLGFVDATKAGQDITLATLEGLRPHGSPQWTAQGNGLLFVQYAQEDVSLPDELYFASVKDTGFGEIRRVFEWPQGTNGVFGYTWLAGHWARAD